MLSYCLKCRKDVESKNPKAVKTKTRRVMFLSKCVVCNSKYQNSWKSNKLEDCLREVKVPILNDLLIINSLF